MQSYLTLEHLWKIYELDETWDKVMERLYNAPQRKEESGQKKKYTYAHTQTHLCLVGVWINDARNRLSDDLTNRTEWVERKPGGKSSGQGGQGQQRSVEAHGRKRGLGRRRRLGE